MKYKNIVTLTAALIFAAVFWIDIHIPLGWAVWVLYMIPLLLLSQPDLPRKFLYAAAAINMILLYTGVLLAPPGISVKNAMFNRTSYIIIIWVISYFQNQKRMAFLGIFKSEERFRQLADSMPQIVWTTDSQGQVDYINRRWMEFSGLPEDKSLGQGWAELLHPDDREFAVEKWTRCSEKGEIYEINYRLRRYDGEYRWFLGRGVPSYDKQGNIVKWYGTSTDVHESKTTGEELEQQKYLLQLIMESLPVGVWIYDENGKITNGNKIAREIWKGIKYTPIEEYYEYKGWWADTGKLIKPEEWASARAIRHGESSIREVVEIECFDGSHKTIFNSSVPVYDSNKKIIGAVAVNEDITELKRIENALRLSQKRLQLAAEHFDFNFVIYDSDRRFLYVNSYGRKMSGKTIDEYIGKRDEDIFPPEDTCNYLSVLIRSVETKSTQKVEFTHNKTSLILTFVPILDESGNIYQLISIGYDITGLRNTENELKYQKSLLQRILETLPVGVFISDPDGRLMIINDLGNQIWGGEKYLNSGEHPEYKGWRLDTNERIEKDDWPMTRAIQKKEISLNEYIRIESFDKKNKIILADTVPVIDEQGKMLAAVSVVQDVTERKELELKLTETLNELQKSNKDLEQFAYIASHDLQEPVRMVHSFTQLLARNYGDKFDARASEYLGFISEGAKRMQLLIHDLLEYSRVTTRSKVFQRVNCGAVMQAVINNLQVGIEESHANISYCNLPTIIADEMQMMQLFQNLVGNAIKFCHGKNPEVSVQAMEHEDEWVFSISDNGIGIDPKYAGKIFVIFQRLHERSKYPGTGIGLSLCKKIVERHHGRIWFESEPGNGTTFYFTIPKHISKY